MYIYASSNLRRVCEKHILDTRFIYFCMTVKEIVFNDVCYKDMVGSINIGY